VREQIETIDIIFSPGTEGSNFIPSSAGSETNPCPTPQNYGAKRFTSDKRNWRYQLRFGLFEISDVDMSRIARAMGASLV
jgi:hypothetical protein